ncbi:MAG: FliM/FliN family flagellar motor switch protein [Candidatus Sulfotelmatobacter sp.]|jgi:flagellar motor switch protein FliN/FliY
MNAQTLDVLLDVELPVTIRLGMAQMTFGDVAGFNAGSLVEFDSAPEELVEVLVNGRVVARGEMVMAEGNHAVRITEISSNRERLDMSSERERVISGAH